MGYSKNKDKDLVPDENTFLLVKLLVGMVIFDKIISLMKAII